MAIPDGPAVVTSTMVVWGAGPYLYHTSLTTFITHTFAADLDVTIQSPAGTVVTLTTDNGAGNDNVFNGTVWDDDANPGGQVPYVTNNGLVTDHWDSTIMETVNPTATAKTWTLHIGNSFGDVPTGNPFYRFIETLLHKGVTGGCGGTNYCPTNATTREQMAVFVLIAKEGAGYAPPACSPPNIFADVPETSPLCKWIEELANRGVVSGCGGGNYCPTGSVTREQMGVFLAVTFGLSLYGV